MRWRIGWRRRSPDSCSDEIFVIERPAALHLDKPAAAVGTLPGPANVDAGWSSVFIVLICIARVVGWGNKRRWHRTSFDIRGLHIRPAGYRAGNSFGLDSGRTLDGIVRREVCF